VQFPSFSLEYSLISRGLVVSGADEVGRGCLAGPVVACLACITEPSNYLPNVRDSKTMPELQREKYASLLKDVLPYFAIGEASNLEVDKLGIRKATHLAMLRAYWQLSKSPDIILMDGESATIPILSKTFQYDHGDALHYSIAAASILAKVYRDNLMKELSNNFDGYSFEKHKGYGTKIHYEAIKKLGITPYHRLSFLKSLSRH